MKLDGYLLFSVILALLLFGIYRSQFLLYFSLLYAFVLYLNRESIRPLPKTNVLRFGFGVLAILISLFFIVFRIGRYPSPVSFYFLFMWGLLELNFSAPLLVRAMPPTIIATAMVMKTGLIAMAINKTSKVFVDITSKLVNVMLRISNTPIRVHENVANVSNGIVVIGSGCSGLDAFLLYLLASLLLIHHRKFTVKEAALIVIGSLGVIPLNAIRIFTLLFIGQKWGISYLKLFHSHLGDMMFIAYVFAYWTLVIRHFSREEGPKNFYILNRT